MRLLISLLAALAVAACAKEADLVWRHPAHSDGARFEVESLQCQQFAAAPVLYRHDYNRGIAVLVGARKALFDSRYIECMNRLGYYHARE